MQEVGDVDPQGVGNVQEMAQLHLRTGLHALDAAAVDAGLMRQGLLGHAHVQAPNADAVADGPAGVEDPFRLFGWHARNVLRIMIISQQQI